MKKVLTITALVLVLAFALVACAAPAPAAETSAAAEPAATEAPAAEEPAATEAPATAEEPTDAAEPSALAEEAAPNAGEENDIIAKAIAEQMTTDGKQLMPDPIEKPFPERPADPQALPETDAGRYYDMEYVGWDAGAKSEEIPASPGDGPAGKHIIVIVHGDHAWTTAYEKGMKQACEALGMTVEVQSPNWDQALQDQLIEQAINAKPDAIVLIPLSAENATQQFRKITQAGIPAFGSNTLTTSDAMQYMVAWTGPDDWAQMRQLADTLGTAMNGEGGIAYVTHNVGTSPYYARTYGPITEFAAKYPNIETLDIQSPGFEAAKVKQVVADWITRFGDKLKAIFVADDSTQAIGAVDAVKESGREDILIVGAGNSKTGQDLVKSGDMLIINYQSAEGDAGLSARTVAEWFSGKEVLPVGYLTTDMITKDNVEDFYPTQW